MKARNFIKTYGLDLAKRDIACFESGFITEQDFSNANGFEIKELYRVVQSHELVNSLGGLEKATAQLRRDSILRWVHPETERLRQAITDVTPVEDAT